MIDRMNIDKLELANKWLRLQNKNISILNGIKARGITKIIIYGASEFALRLIELCDKEDELVEIVAITDKKISSKGTYYNDIPLITIDDIVKMNTRDVYIVITAMGFYEEIADELMQKGITNFTSLRELIYDVYC